MRLLFLDLHGKSWYLASRLAEQGFSIVGPDDPFDVLLVDTDHPLSPPVPWKHDMVKAAMRLGIPVGIYPHGAPPVLDYDMGRKPLGVAFEFVHGEGHAEVYRRIGLRRRVEVIGWSYCDIRSPSPEGGADITHLVFAPIHPWANGEGILDVHRAANEVAYQQFLEFPCEFKLVRMYGYDAPNGVDKRVEGVEYTQSDLGQGVDIIDEADAVISYGTFAHTALARGKRVAMIYPHPPHFSDDGKVQAERFADYADYTRYPACIGDAPLDELFLRDTTEWERLFVGGPLDVEKVVGVLNSYRPNRAERRRRGKSVPA